MPTCPYILLGIEHNADEAAAKKAYRALMLGGAHPDRGGDLARAKELGGALQLISEGKAAGRCDCRASNRRGSSSGFGSRGFDSVDFQDLWEAARRAARSTEPPRHRPNVRHPGTPPRRPDGWEEVPEHPESVDEWSARCHRNAARYASAPGHRGAAGFEEGPWPRDPRPPDPEKPRFKGCRDPATGEWVSAEEAKARAVKRAAAFRQKAAEQDAEAREAEERVQRERAEERERAQARQNAQNARPTEPPKFYRAAHPPGRPIYEPGASNPPEAVRKLFDRAKPRR